MPTSGRDEEYLEVIHALARDISTNMEEDTVLLIGADTNQSDKSTLRRTNAMKTFQNQFCLKSILLNKEPTFHHNNQTSESQIDHIYYFIPGEAKMKVCMKEHLCQKETSQNTSAHDVIVGEIKTEMKEETNKEPDHTKSYTEFKVKKPKWDESNLEDYQHQTFHILKELLDRFQLPENIPLLTEMFSNMMVLSAEQNFETSNPNRVKKINNHPYFSKEIVDSYKTHEKVCRLWRLAGRPCDNSHPAKLEKLESQRNLRKIARESENFEAHKLHNELMETHFKDIGRVCKNLKSIRGEKYGKSQTPYIETMSGTYTGANVLEGFCANTEILCNEKENSQQTENSFLKMCYEDNEIISNFTR